MADRNVLGGPLEPCGTDPLTGFYRDGCCSTGPEDIGLHTICAVMTAEFLRAPALDRQRPVDAAARSTGSPASCPATAGVSPPRTGCGPTTTAAPPRWCWPPPTSPLSTWWPLEALQQHAVDVPDDPGEL